MLTDDVHPTTLEGVKRLAKQIRKEKGVSHSIALDLAARAANYENYKQAHQKLSSSGSAQ